MKEVRTQMDTQTITGLAVNSSWLDSEMMTAGDVTSNSMTLGSVTFGYQYPYWTYPVYVSSPAARPIRLTMSEIEKLRKVARADKAVRDILEKFTNLIEITVDLK